MSVLLMYGNDGSDFKGAPATLEQLVMVGYCCGGGSGQWWSFSRSYASLRMWAGTGREQAFVVPARLSQSGPMGSILVAYRTGGSPVNGVHS